MKNNEVEGKELRSLKYIENDKVILYKNAVKLNIEILKAWKIFQYIIFKYLPFYWSL